MLRKIKRKLLAIINKFKKCDCFNCKLMEYDYERDKFFCCVGGFYISKTNGDCPHFEKDKEWEER